MTRLIATLFGIGQLRPAPGTWGSLAALPLAWLIAWALGPVGLAVAIVVVAGLGLWAVNVELDFTTDPDPGEIVIDEVAGQWVALLPVAIGAAWAGAPLLALWPGWIVAFLAFRLFDIWKPGPIGWADRMGGAGGLMLDDLLAGLAAAICVALLAGVAHGVMLL